MSGPQWTWQFLAVDEQAVDRPVSPAFTSRFDAEAWLGEQWRSLAGEGVASARLLHQGAVVAPAVPLRKG
ncbi:hypothetical protein [Actinotalea sp. Marseille-Q4924]|uniref:hypothetical protein n=1 Tax=Actinotalea sp. Marseille-Q4924 TaxID=2866571 RepID=UPI001CE4044C|nr:hypothetical protein [Actinotalea sp. Marseille-Q4924]